jgi:hypothetical protein
MPPTEESAGYAGDESFASLREYARRVGAGRAVANTKGFLVDLEHREFMSPGTAYCVAGPEGGVQSARARLRGRGPQRARHRRGEVAEAEPALPGWTFSVNLLFP